MKSMELSILSRAAAAKRQSVPSVAKPVRKGASVKLSVVPPASGNSHEELIRQRAYSLYEARNCEGGHDLEDWLQAEAQILHSAAPDSAHP